MSEKLDIVDVEVTHHEGDNMQKIGRDEMWGDSALLTVAQDTEDEEKTMTIREAIRRYKKAIFWSVAISLCVIMEGYDTNLLSQFFAYREYFL